MDSTLIRQHNEQYGKNIALLSVFFLLLIHIGLVRAEINPEAVPEGLIKLKDTKVDYAYLKPGVDLSVYKKIMLLDAPVSFREDWKENQRRYYDTKVSDQDIKRTEESSSKVFHDTFVKELQSKKGYPIVADAGQDVLQLRPTVYDLNLVALDTLAARSEVYSKSEGSASLMLDLVDSVSGELLARIYDTKKDRRNDFYERSNRVSNTRDTRKIFSSWARLLRKSFDRVHKEGTDWKI